MPEMIDIPALYAKYGDELFDLTMGLRPIIHRMHRAGFATTFGDVEGETLYLLVREYKPQLLFEISPNAGWSTNYILSALTANGSGTLHSFDVATHLQGKPTEEVIRGNQLSTNNQSQLVVHIGDAMQTVKTVAGTVDFALIDSNHSAAFAQWYMGEVFPRIRGIAVVQDIAFRDHIEHTSEAMEVWEWIQRAGVPAQLVGQCEERLAQTGVRDHLAERRPLRSNSIVFRLPAEPGEPPVFEEGPVDLLAAAAKLTQSKSDMHDIERLLNRAVRQIMRDNSRVNRHRLLFDAAAVYKSLGLKDDVRRCCQRALGITMMSDVRQRVKGAGELAVGFWRLRQWQLLLQLLTSALFEPWMLSRILQAYGRVLLRRRFP